MFTRAIGLGLLAACALPGCKPRQGSSAQSQSRAQLTPAQAVYLQMEPRNKKLSDCLYGGGGDACQKYMDASHILDFEQNNILNSGQGTPAYVQCLLRGVSASCAVYAAGYVAPSSQPQNDVQGPSSSSPSGGYTGGSLVLPAFQSSCPPGYTPVVGGGAGPAFPPGAVVCQGNSSFPQVADVSMQPSGSRGDDVPTRVRQGTTHCPAGATASNVHLSPGPAGVTCSFGPSAFGSVGAFCSTVPDTLVQPSSTSAGFPSTCQNFSASDLAQFLSMNTDSSNSILRAWQDENNFCARVWCNAQGIWASLSQ